MSSKLFVIVLMETIIIILIVTTNNYAVVSAGNFMFTRVSPIYKIKRWYAFIYTS